MLMRNAGDGLNLPSEATETTEVPKLSTTPQVPNRLVKKDKTLRDWLVEFAMVAVLLAVIGFVYALIGVHTSGGLKPWECQHLDGQDVDAIYGTHTKTHRTFMFSTSGSISTRDTFFAAGVVKHPAAICEVALIMRENSKGDAITLLDTTGISKDGSYDTSTQRLKPKTSKDEIYLDVIIGGPPCVDWLKSMPPGFMSDLPDPCRLLVRHSVSLTTH